MRAKSSLLQMKFHVEYWDEDRPPQDVITGPGEIAWYELTFKDTPLVNDNGGISPTAQMRLAWRRLYKQKLTPEAKFEAWADTLSGFEMVDDGDEDQDPTEADTPPEVSES